MSTFTVNPMPAPSAPDEVGKLRALQSQFGLPLGVASLPSPAPMAAHVPAAAALAAPVSASAPPSPLSGATLPSTPAPTPQPKAAPSAPKPVAVKQPSPSQQDLNAAMAERNRMESTGSGVSQIHNPVLRALARVGDIAGTVIAPEVAAAIPGTSLHHDVLLGQQNRRIATDQGEEQKAAQTADAERMANEPLAVPKPNAPWKPITGTNFEQNSETGETRPMEGVPAPAERGARVEPTPAGYVMVGADGKATPIMGPDGKPVMPVPHASAVTGKLVTGTLNGKPAFAEFEPGTGFVDPVTRQPISGFAPTSAADHMTGMGFYALSRILQEETSANPALRALVPALLDKLGIPLTPQQKAQLSGVPRGQPEDESGRPIGTAMPGAPTATTRSAGQVAQRVLAELPRVRQEISSLSPDLGPLAGRWNQFMTGEVGSGGADGEKYAQLRADVHFLTSAAAKFHLNSVRAVQEFNKLADTGKMTKQVLDGFLDAVEPWARTAALQGEGKPTGEAPASAGRAIPKGGKPVVINGKTVGYTMDGKSYIPFGGGE